ncbi:hypothetical protein [Rhizohabitans arisaemae]|uniref:hypothetical protein n=1 Tax=Rhizohabitans arisaemae TaxID=2720610 RepID=UPI0024B1C436|nr:hypothetical protein [Rhizohabitans arisaemae]
MRLITQADENLFQTIVVAAKLGRADPLVERLNDQYAEDWENPQAAFPYALAVVAMLQADVSGFEKHASFNEALETLNDILYTDPAHWLAQYLRARLRTMIPSSLIYKTYLDMERDKAGEGSQELIEVQAAAAWQPYFVSAYALAAHTPGEDGRDPAHVGKTIREAAEAGPRSRVPYPALGAILCEPLVALYMDVTLPERELIATMMRELYPDQPAVRDALGRFPIP